MMRAETSAAVPDPPGTTSRTKRFGQFCACAGSDISNVAKPRRKQQTRIISLP